MAMTGQPTNTNARWRSRRSRSARSRRCASRHTPRNYEIWYTYATGYNPSLNQTINETLARDRHADRTPTSSRSTTPISRRTRLTDRIDNVGSQVMDEIEQVMAMIDAAAGIGDELHRKPRRRRRRSSAAPRTATACARSSRAWCIATKEMEQTNQQLEERLKASKQEINQLQENLEAVRTESLTDPLTSLANRKFFDQALDKAHRRRARQGRAAVADDDRHRPFQEFQRHLRPPHRRPGAAAGRAVGEAERQGPGHRGALRRRGIRHRAAEHARCARRSRSPTTSAAP